MTTTFTGLGDGSSWEDSANWDNGVPGEGDNAVIPDGFSVSGTPPSGVANLEVNGTSSVGVTITVSGLAVFNDASTNSQSGNITGTCTFNGSFDNVYGPINQGTINGFVTFHFYSWTEGTINGTVEFYDGSSNWIGQINGDVSFHDNSYNDATVNGDAIFYDGSYNDTYFLGIVNGNAVFKDGALNGAVVNGDAIFENSSFNSGSISGTAIFRDNAYYANGSIGQKLILESGFSLKWTLSFPINQAQDKILSPLFNSLGGGAF